MTFDRRVKFPVVKFVASTDHGYGPQLCLVPPHKWKMDEVSRLLLCGGGCMCMSDNMHAQVYHEVYHVGREVAWQIINLIVLHPPTAETVIS